MSEESVSKEVSASVSEIHKSSIIAEAEGDTSALTQPKVIDQIDQTIHEVIKENQRQPCDSLIRALDPAFRIEKFRLVQATRSIVAASSASGKAPIGGIVPMLGAAAQLSDLERENTRSAEISDIRSDQKGLGGILEMLQQGSDLIKIEQQAWQILKSTSMPQTAIHSVLNGVAAKDYFALASGPITFIFALQMLFMRLKRR